MSMDKTAIQEIQKASVAGALADQLAETDALVAALPGDFHLEGLERFMDGRNRFRGNMATGSMADYVRYVAENGKSQCFVDAENMKAKVFFNLGTQNNPGHGDNTATLQLEKTSPLRAVLSMNGLKLSQKGLAEWLEDWKESLEVVDQHGESMTLAQAVAAVRRITIKAKAESTHTDSDFGASRSAMEEVEAKAEDRLPNIFSFRCVPYEGLDERAFTLRMSVITTGEKPQLSTRIVQLEKAQEDMAEEFKGKLADQLPEEVSVYIGSFSVGK